MNQKIQNLRQSFVKYNIDAYIVPCTDEYQNEYTPPCAKRLEYITGFTGSNGYVIVAQDKIYFFTDVRYLLQAKKELPDFFDIRDFRTLSDFALGDLTIGYNPMIFTKKQVSNLLPKLNLVEINDDLIDEIWTDKPANPASKVYIYDMEYAGKSAKDKILEIRNEIKTKADYVLVTDPTSVCWALNLRASDIEFCPIMLGRLLISQDEVVLFTDLSRISDEVRLSLDFMHFANEKETEQYLSKIESKVMLDPSNCSVGISNLIKNKVEHVNPCQLPQYCKNEVEINGAIEAHVKDAVALCEALAWIHDQHKAGNATTEYDAGLKLSYFRSKQEGYVMDSFPPIVGFKDNGAIIHYRSVEETAKKIEGDGMLLIDSGGHYLGGTTDVTRNLFFGTPSNEVKKRYTEVLKGHIAVAMQVFPEGTSGFSLDTLARMFLWNEGLDYAHGTGHGVGNFLSVHEGSVLSRYATFPSIKRGTILSNEPGFYKNGEYGIRVENLLYVKDLGNGFLAFENLTLVPYCHKLIDFTLINNYELDYLTNYYAIIKTKVRHLLSDEAKEWLDGEISL